MIRKNYFEQISFRLKFLGYVSLNYPIKIQHLNFKVSVNFTYDRSINFNYTNLLDIKQKLKIFQ